MKGLRLGVPKEYFIAGIDPEIEKAVRARDRRLQEPGRGNRRGLAAAHEVRRRRLLHHRDGRVLRQPRPLRRRALRQARGESQGHPRHVRPHPRRGLRARGEAPHILGTYVLSSGYYDAYYNRAQKVRQLIGEDFRLAFEQCDALLTPTSPTAAFKIGERTQDPLQMYLADIFTIAVNLAGTCGISIPCGFTSASSPSACKSSARAGARNACSASPTPTSRRPRGHKEKPPL